MSLSSALITAPAAPVQARPRRLRPGLAECVVVLAPVMFYSLGAGANVSAAYVLLPVFVVAVYLAPVRSAASIRATPDVLMGVLLATMVLSATFASLRDSLADPVGVVSTISKVVISAVVFICMYRWYVNASASARSRMTSAWAWTATAIAVLSTLAALHALPVNPIIRSEEGVRTSGTFDDPNLFGTYLIVSIPFILTQRRTLPVWVKTVQLLALTVAVVSTGSRGTLLALGVMLAVAVFLPGHRTGPARFLAFLLAVVGIYLVVSQPQWISELPGVARVQESAQEASAYQRLALWQEASAAWQSSPIVGIGPGQFSGSGGHVTHNTFLNFLAEDGILGALAFLTIPAVIATRLWGHLRTDRVARWAFLGLVGLVVEMFTLNLENVPFLWMFAGVALGIATAPTRAAHPDHAEAVLVR